jgi:hypothetical protein
MGAGSVSRRGGRTEPKISELRGRLAAPSAELVEQPAREGYETIKTLTIGFSDISVPKVRLRLLRAEVVDQLAWSIRAQGLLHPILVRPTARGSVAPYMLVAGRHRLEAVRQLGQDTIRAEIHAGLSAAAAQLAEIDEKLMRANLSPAEEALHIGARKTVYEKLHPETKQGGAPGKAGGGKRAKDLKLGSFVHHTSEQTGKGRRTVARSSTRAKKIAPAVLATVAGTTIEKGDELDALAKLPEIGGIAKRENLAERTWLDQLELAHRRLHFLTH